jgi:hypothetical protein
MPADNVEGFRSEVIAALKHLRFGVLRFPGGNFVSAYEWRNGMSDIDKRPPISIPSGMLCSQTMSALTSSSLCADFLVSILISPSTPASATHGLRASWSSTPTALPRPRRGNGAPQTAILRLIPSSSGVSATSPGATTRWALSPAGYGSACRSPRPGRQLVASRRMYRETSSTRGTAIRHSPGRKFRCGRDGRFRSGTPVPG